MEAKKQERRAPQRKRKRTTGNPRRVPAGQDGFTASEVTVAEHLVDLSQSPACDGGGGDSSGGGGGSVHRPTLPPSSFSSPSSPRSISARAPAVVTVAEADEEDKEEGHGMGRAPQKYRPITDLYAATTPIVVEYARFVKISLKDRRRLKKRCSGGK